MGTCGLIAALAQVGVLAVQLIWPPHVGFYYFTCMNSCSSIYEYHAGCIYRQYIYSEAVVVSLDHVEGEEKRKRLAQYDLVETRR